MEINVKAEEERKRKFMEARGGSVREFTVPPLSKRLKDEEIKTVIVPEIKNGNKSDSPCIKGKSETKYIDMPKKKEI